LVTSSLNGANNKDSESSIHFLRPDNTEISLTVVVGNNRNSPAAPTLAKHSAANDTHTAL